MFSLIETIEYFLIGSCIGSFLNVVIYRLPKNLSIVKPRSFCPKCKKKLTWRENIPIFSWLIQRGKCINCGQKINAKYPINELSIGLLFVLFSKSNPFLYSSMNFDSIMTNYVEILFSWFFLSLLFIISFIDYKHFWIPQILINLGFFFGVLNLFFIQYFSEFNQSQLIINCFIASLFSYFSFEMIRILARYIFKKEALGKGDSKIVSMMALWLGPLGIAFSIAITYIFAAFIVLLALNLKIIQRKQVIPFAPFLSLGALTVWFLGNQQLMQYIYFY